MSVILTAQEAEARRSEVQNQPGQFSKTVTCPREGYLIQKEKETVNVTHNSTTE